MQRAEGADVVAMTPAELSERFPFMDFSDVEIGTFGRSGEGWFDAWSLLSLVRGAARREQVAYVSDTVTGFEVTGGAITGVRLASGGALSCDCCVIAAGAVSGRLVAELGIDLPVSPRKRTVFNFRSPLSGAEFPMLFDSSGAWVRPEGDGFIGGIQPPESEDGDATDDYEPHRHLLEETLWPLLAHRVPAMEQLRLGRAWAGHYEVNAMDHNGVIGPHDELRNLIFATGFSGHGLMHAPAVGRGVAELIVDGRYATLDLSSLGWERIRARRPLVESVVY
jgi:glycine/D-amino acid oxidase-like deaminating enzyme